MPPLSKLALSRLANFSRAAKRAIEHLSPRKSSKKRKIDEDDDHLGNSCPTENIPEAVQTYSTSVFEVPPLPASAVTGITITFSLPPVPLPKATVEDCEDEDSILESYRCFQGDEVLLDDLCDTKSEVSSLSSLGSIEMGPEPECPPAPSFAPKCPSDRHLYESPSLLEAKKALSDLKVFLRGPEKGKTGHFCPPVLCKFVEHRVRGMIALLSLFCDHRSLTYNKWGPSSLQAAVAIGHSSTYCARVLRKLCRAYISHREILIINPYASWRSNMLVDEDLKGDVMLFLQGLHPEEISAKTLRDYLNQAGVQEEYGIARKISLSTANTYLHSLGYRFSQPPKGQFVDGHEREDVVDHRQNKFLPRMAAAQPRMRIYDAEGELKFSPSNGRPITVWFHDESIFYAHDRRGKRWFHKDAPAKPYAKGDGASLMIADFVSADYGWLASPGGQSARVILRPGKNRDGYMSNDDVLEQAAVAMNLVQELYPHEDHLFVYDNATTHLKRPDASRSARKMPKNPKQWLVESPVRDSDGKVIPGQKVKVQMQPGYFNGETQSFYHPPGHDLEGQFKGMAQILEERGISTKSKLAECKGFKCAPPKLDCCCRRILYNQPDFVDVPSNLEELGDSLGVSVLFLPKYHCELNFIEQCWGYAKRLYRLNPESSREDALERNTLNAIDAVPLISMRRFANRSLRFMDAYRQGLNGKEAAWAGKKYRGHRVLPPEFRDDLKKVSL